MAPDPPSDSDLRAYWQEYGEYLLALEDLARAVGHGVPAEHGLDCLTETQRALIRKYWRHGTDPEVVAATVAAEFPSVVAGFQIGGWRHAA